VSRAPQGWSEQRTLLTRDGVRISAAARLPAFDRAGEPVPSQRPRLAYVLAHGFTGTWRSVGLTRVAERLATGPGGAGVVAFDFRGHGRSGGTSTVGDREIWDVAAAVGWARLLGYDRVATIGFSMGASVVVRHAALVGGVDAVAAVSGPARWFYKGTPAMRRLHLVVERPAGRLVARTLLGTRIGSDRWDPAPEEPRAVAGRIAPTPFLVVHGDRDRYFPLDHPRQLAAAAGPTAELWVERGFGHAEAAIGADLTDRIAAWVRTCVYADPVLPAGAHVSEAAAW
jgi:pimeloyl-ACP methyl ester carboxylesterase